MDLPTGTYLLSATVHFKNSANFIAADNSRRIYCLFSGDSVSYSFSFPGGGILGYDLTATMHSVLNISSGGVDLQCHGFGINQNNVFALDRRLTAVKIEGNVVVQ